MECRLSNFSILYVFLTFHSIQQSVLVPDKELQWSLPKVKNNFSLAPIFQKISDGGTNVKYGSLTKFDSAVHSEQNIITLNVPVNNVVFM